MPALATFTVDVLSKKAGVDTASIEAFEQLGLIARPRRKGGLRLYSPDDVHRLSSSAGRKSWASFWTPSANC